MFTNSGITAAYIGSDSVSKIYIGSTLIWPLTPTETYTFVSSIWSSGDTNNSRIINTNYSATTTLEMDFEGRLLASNSNAIIGHYGEPDNNDYRFFCITTAFLDIYNKRINGAANYAKVRRVQTSNLKFTVTLDDETKVIKNGSTVTSVPNVPIFIYLRGLLVNRFTLTDNGVIVFNGVPAVRDNDGYIGLYDTVTNTFFPSEVQNNLHYIP